MSSNGKKTMKEEETARTNLLDAALEIVLQNGMLVPVLVHLVETKPEASLSKKTNDKQEAKHEHEFKLKEDKESANYPHNPLSKDGPHSCSSRELLVVPGITVSELKGLIRTYFDIPEKEQRLSVAGKHLLYGCLDSNIAEIMMQEQQEYLQTQQSQQPQQPQLDTPIQIELKQVSVNPHLESLLEVVLLQDWQARDEIMPKLVRHRVGHQCYRGHELVELTDNAAVAFSSSRDECHRCHIPLCQTSHGVHGCRRGNKCHLGSSFYLCTLCMAFESRRPAPVVEVLRERFRDPHQLLQLWAKSFGRKLAREFWNPVAHHQDDNDDNDNDEEDTALVTPGFFYSGYLVPRLPKQSKKSGNDQNASQRSAFTANSLQLAKGVCVKIQFDREAYRMLKEDANVPEEYIRKAQVHQVCENGMTFRQMATMRKQWCKDNALCHILEQTMRRDRHSSSSLSTCDNSNGNDNSQELLSGVSFVTTLELVSFGLEEVVYEARYRLVGDEPDYW